VSPEADRLLRGMSDFLGQQREFTVRVRGATEAILQSGQKVQVESNGVVYVKRPSMLRIDRVGDDDSTQTLVDGKTVTFYSERQNGFLSVPAAGTLDATLANLESSGQIELPGADLLYRDAFAGLMEDVVSGQSLGPSIIDGAPTHHLVFRGRDVDWQIWISDGPRPLPKKYVITSKKVEGSPEYEIVLSNWNLDPRLGDELFKFRPPRDARQIPPTGLSQPRLQQRTR
jgi:hypothetical protein